MKVRAVWQFFEAEREGNAFTCQRTHFVLLAKRVKKSCA